MTKRQYNDHSEIDFNDYEYVTSVAACHPEEIDIQDINEFLNEVDDYMSDFDEVDMTQVKKELGL